MGAAVGTDDKKSVNVELNIVPFIDLMSCLTAFLLVTAVWVNIAQISIQPKGKSRDQSTILDPDEKPNLSVLIQSDQIWIGVSRVNEFTPIKNNGTERDWAAFEEKLKKQREPGAFFTDRTDLEVAAESTTNGQVKYQDLIHAMDIALKVGFKDVGLTDPNGLSARPSL